jgi:hypothetical protein
MSAARNTRLAWIASELGQGKSNAQIVIDCMAKFHGVSETTARRDIKEVLQRFKDIEDDSIAENKTKFMEIGWKLLNDCKSVAQYGPAVNLFKTLAAISGLLDSDKNGNAYAPAGHGGVAPETGTPEAKLVRERIASLLRNKEVKNQANAAGIDLSVLRKETKDD